MNERKFSTAKEYFDSLPEHSKTMLLQMKHCILKVVPNAIELLNYNVPAYALKEGGKREEQIMIAAFKNHVGLYPHPTAIEHFSVDLDSYKKGKGSVQFPLDKPLPIELIEKIIAYRYNIMFNN